MFQEGDIVTLKHGVGLMQVLKVDPSRREALVNYCSSIRSGHTDKVKRRPFSDLKPAKSIPQEEPMAKLYETNDGKFGTELAKNSQGQLVLELKGSGEVKAYDLKNLKEVVPYTVCINFPSGPGQLHVETLEGKLAKGDCVMMAHHIGVVVEVDTKCRNPHQTKTALKKLVTEDLL